MIKSRILKAHQVLTAIEELRYHVVTIANLSNPFTTNEYEEKLYDKLESVESSIQDIARCLGSTHSQEQGEQPLP